MRVEAVDHNGNPIPDPVPAMFAAQVTKLAEKIFVNIDHDNAREAAECALDRAATFWLAAAEHRDELLRIGRENSR